MSERLRERTEQGRASKSASDRTSEGPSTYIPIPGCSEPLHPPEATQAGCSAFQKETSCRDAVREVRRGVPEACAPWATWPGPSEDRGRTDWDRD